MVTLDVKGLRQAMKNLRTLGSRAAKNSTTRALRRSAKPVVEATRRQVRSRSGAFAKSIKVTSSRLDKGTGRVTVKIGSRGTKSLASKSPSAFYSRKGKKSRRIGASRVAHLVVGGTKPHVITGLISIKGRVVASVNHPGAKPQPIFERGARAGFHGAISTFNTVFGQEVLAEAKKLPK